MPRARDLLERFRPIGTPGAAAPAGVPADRTADRFRELQPVVDRLVDVDAECVRIRDAATAEAERRRQQAVAEAAAIVAASRIAAPANRTATATRVRQEGAALAVADVEQAEHEAAATTARAQQRMDDYVRRVGTAVRHLLSAEPARQRVP